jgi:4'-phosphopantetheinyl transferase
MRVDSNMAKLMGRGTNITALPAPAAAPGIRLWWCSLDAPPPLIGTFEGYLSQAELSRASRFGNRRLRERYVTGRGSLRTILGGELGVEPGKVEIVRGIRGRPQLSGTPSLDFNISHTGDVAIVGLLQGARIGVDVERIDRVVNVAGIARKFLTANERRELGAADTDAARARLLTLWTCKEAMSKATGDALSAPFGSLDIHLSDQPLLRAGPNVYQPDRWTLHSAAVPPAYVATVAVWRPA